MKRLIFYIIILFVGIGGFKSCKEDELGPVVNDKISPQPVKIKNVENIPGGAIVDVELSSDDDLLGVEVKYTLASGVEKVKRISNFSNTIKIEGFGDTLQHVVELFSVDRSENRSEAVDITIKPKVPPVMLIKESIEMFNAFGGVKYNWINETEAPVALLLVAEDTITSKLEVIESVYTSEKEGSFTLRGQDTIPKRFGVVIRDRFENYSDTVSGEFKPLFEEFIDASDFKLVALPGDTKQNGFANLWKSDVGSIIVSDGVVKFPMSYTIDLSKQVKFSRIKVWHYNWGKPYHYFLYYNLNYKSFNIWGSNDPSVDGSWESWTLLKECVTSKVSGLPVGKSDDSRYVTQEDLDKANAGFEFEIPVEAESYRFLRIEVLDPWLPGVSGAALGYCEIYGRVN